MPVLILCVFASFICFRNLKLTQMRELVQAVDDEAAKEQKREVRVQLPRQYILY